MTLQLPQSLALQIADEANAFFPRECCGLLEGWRSGDDFQVTALHPCRNLSDAPDCFDIDPADHFRAARTARDRARDLIGCYHSHPFGSARPSARDLAGAGEDNFVWLIAGPEGLKSFVYSGGRFVSLGLAAGADLVTSSL